MQPDNQSNLPQSPPLEQASLPQLLLSDNQRQILAEHVGDAIFQICSIQFTAATQVDCMIQTAFQQGRRLAYQSILTFDNDRIEQLAKENS